MHRYKPGRETTQPSTAVFAPAGPAWEEDRQAQRGGVAVSYALEVKYPQVTQTWGWLLMFPAVNHSTDPRRGIVRRHHLFNERLQRAIKNALSPAVIRKPVSVHALRHAPVARVNRIRTAQEFLGHRELNTTMFYIHALKVQAGTTASRLDALMNRTSLSTQWRMA